MAIRGTALALGCAASLAGSDFAFAEATIEELQARMQRGELTAQALTEAYRDRIAKIDRAGPRINAVIELNPDALAIARQLDAERASGKVRGPLHGIPILLKDNVATGDNMETTAGSLALVGARPGRDAHLVARLREAGAVVLGKTNLSEWANFRGDRSISGWSGRGGQTLNPYALDRSPSGSSSGSAVAVAANLCVAAIGTETSGSIISPSSACGIVGVKPTVGLVSRSGIIPIAASFDTAGPMTRTVRDAALVLAAIAGPDPADAATQPLPADLPARIAAALPRDGLRGARLGVIRGVFRPNLDDVFTAVIATLKEAGAEVVEAGELPSGMPSPTVMEFEIKAGLNEYFSTLGAAAQIKSLADVIRFNENNWAKELPLFGQQRLIRAQARGPLSDAAYVEALANCRRMTRTEGIDARLAEHRLDALVTLALAPAGLLASGTPDPIFGEKGTAGGGSSHAAIAGYPSVTVPTAHVRGLPVGVLFFGPAWTDAKLLAFAADYEARTRARRPPAFTATIAAD